jgi:hypothetical protein
VSAAFSVFRPAAAPRKWPMRTTTRSWEGMMKVFCPPAPAIRWASRGMFQSPSPLIQKKAP